MSSRKRRLARKIALLARMDLQMRSYWRPAHMEKRDRVLAAMKALGRRIGRTDVKDRAWEVIQAARAANPHPALGIRGRGGVNRK